MSNTTLEISKRAKSALVLEIPLSPAAQTTLFLL